MGKLRRFPFFEKQREVGLFFEGLAAALACGGGNQPAQRHDGEEVGDDHELIEHIRKLPCKVIGDAGAEEDEHYGDDGIHRDRLFAEQVFHIDAAEEVPAEDGGEGKEHQADGHEQAAGGIAHDAGEGDLRHVGLADALGGAGGKDAVAGIQGGDHDQCGHGENDKGIDEYTDHGDDALLVGAADLCHGVGVRGGAHAGLITEKAALDALADGLLEGKAEAAAEAAALKAKGIEPCLAVILVGENPASQVYVRGKVKDCGECGIKSLELRMPETTTQEELLAKIAELAADKTVNGILVQLPLPKQIDERAVIDAIPPEKDVDGFSPVNVGRMQTGQPCFLPCTPAGCIRMIESTGTKIDGKNAVVIGRSNIVGKPAALLLLAKNATVTVCHSHTANLKEICANADILVAAVGRAGFVTGDMVKPGAVVIDVGINVDENGKLCGDVDFEKVEPHTSAITPVPGGVGPMTIAMLMNNCVESMRGQK